MFRLLVLFTILLASSVFGADGQFSITAFGAKGDGVTDDTIAFQKAADAAGKVGGSVVVPPVGPGKGYVVTRTVNLPLGAGLIGSPAGMNSNAWAAFDLPEKHVVGSKIFARPAESEYSGKAKKPLFNLSGGNTVRGVWILYDRQPWPTDQQFSDPKSAYHYKSFEEARSRFIREHVKPYGPTIYVSSGSNTVVEDVICDRYYDFFFQATGAKTAINRVYLYGYKSGFTVLESFDVNRFSDVHLCPNVGPATPGKVGGNKSYSWIYGIVVSQLDNVGIHLGKSDGYQISNSFIYGVHTGVRFGCSKDYPIRYTVAGENAFLDTETKKQTGFSTPYTAQGPWGNIANLDIDGCNIGYHLVWPTPMVTCKLSNSYISTAFDDGQDLSPGISRQGAFVVEPTYCRANDINITPSILCSNIQVSSFNMSERFGKVSVSSSECGGRVFLLNGDATISISNLQINHPYNRDSLYAVGSSAGKYNIAVNGFIETGELRENLVIGPK